MHQQFNTLHRLPRCLTGTWVLIVLSGLCRFCQAQITVAVNQDDTVYPPIFDLQSITVSDYTVDVERLANGTSSIVEGTPTGTLGTSPEAADNFDLNTLVARTGLTGDNAIWTITMIGGVETWRDSNGNSPDFFVFEAGANDDIGVRPILTGGLPGQPITFSASQWTDTGLRRTGSPNSGQTIGVITFSVADLLDDTGNPLTTQSSIEGISITSGTLDPTCFCAVVPASVTNRPPVVDAGATQTILWPFVKSVRLNASVTDDDPDSTGLLTMQWSVLSGAPVVFEDNTSPTTLVTFPGPGTWELRLEVTDDLPQTASDTVTITVNEPLCPAGDMNTDCRVAVEDLFIVAQYWLSSADGFNLAGDDTMNLVDLALFSQAWQDDWTGSVTVVISPQSALDEGAMWKIDNGPWQPAGTQRNSLIPGTHTITFNPVDGWIAPDMQTVELARNQNLTIAQSYAAVPDTTLLISEFMASNVTGIKDQQAEYEDWIEIYNYGSADIDLASMYLTDDIDDPTRWAIPSGSPAQTTVAAGRYLVIFADGETDEGILHAPFGLSSSNGQIALFESDGKTLIDSFAYDRQTSDISCGRVSQSDLSLKYFTVATPGTANSSTYDGIVADTTFDRDRGFYDAPFVLTISTQTDGATIVYTTDGSKPAKTHGQTYSTTIPINTTAVIRAFAYKSGCVPTNVDTQTYIFLNDVVDQPKNIPGYPNPNTWLGGNGYNIHDYEMDPDVVDNPAYSSMIIGALKDVPTLSIVADPADMDMTGSGGFYWGSAEEPASVELIYPHDNSKSIQADCAIEPHSHNRMKRSLRLSFKTEYGQSVFASSLLTDAPLNGENADRTLDRIVLRGGNNRSWARVWNPEKTTYTMDQWYRDKQIQMSGIGVHGTFVHLYINGLYWGLYNPVERPDAWFQASYLGGEKEDYYSVSHGGSHGGDASRWNYLKNTLVNKDMTVAANYSEMKQYLDIPEFMDYLILCWYIGMVDWPSNNWWGGNRNNPPGPFQYFCWDGEWSWETTRGHNNGWVHPDFRASQSGGTTAPALWHSLRQNQEFMMLFADRAYKHLFNDGPLTNANSIADYLTLNDFVRDAVVGESARWGDTCDSVGHPTRTRDVHFNAAEAETVGPGFMADNVEKFISSLRAEGYYPGIDPPVFNQQCRCCHGCIFKKLTAIHGFTVPPEQIFSITIQF